jgi:hypothetical protein
MLNLWLDNLLLGFEAQQVIAARLMRLARADATAALEANRMVQEKVAAFFEAQAAAGVALARGDSLRATVARAHRPYRRRVRANRRRLKRKS